MEDYTDEATTRRRKTTRRRTRTRRVTMTRNSVSDPHTVNTDLDLGLLLNTDPGSESWIRIPVPVLKPNQAKNS